MDVRTTSGPQREAIMNRRQFLSTAAAGAAMFTRIPDGRAATYDLIIKGGRVIDPSLGLNAVRDVAIAGGRIAAVDENIAVDATDSIDARGKLVVPGLIDVHVHAARTKEGPALCLKDGVTAWVDAGSNGADNIDETVANAKAAPNHGRVLVNISRGGIIPGGELHDLRRVDAGLAKEAIAKHRDTIVGVKARLSIDVAGENDQEALKRAQEAASAYNLPVMIHIGQSVSPLPKLLDILKPGDIVTHMYAPAPNGMLDDNGRVLPEVMAARRRGILFDFGNGVAGHFTWGVVESALKQGFRPDTFSTDWNVTSPTTGVVDFPNVMSKFLMFAMPLGQVIARATFNAARIFPAFHDLGTLNIGAPADVAVLELREGNFPFLDNFQGTRTGKQRLFPVATVIGGKKAPPRA
jgi:dihydroorotase